LAFSRFPVHRLVFSSDFASDALKRNNQQQQQNNNKEKEEEEG